MAGTVYGPYTEPVFDLWSFYRRVCGECSAFRFIELFAGVLFICLM